MNEWNNLVLLPGHKSLVQALVENHTENLNSNDDSTIGMDLVPGKGRGCIILLHGVPGVGKTSTAECVAAHTKKPLYPITCGDDIGYRPEDVERNMANHFKLAHRWGCVLLLDEADVFLARRDQKDIQRNGLVSVFLRILEYYSGILFLTTNRVGDLDDAFRSRLHLSLYYPNLTKKQTKKIFQRNFARIVDINGDREKNSLPTFAFKDPEAKIIDWALKMRDKLSLNGRQIRNTFQTVLALAEFFEKNRNNTRANNTTDSGGIISPIVISKKYFKIVTNASIEFNDYLKATHGGKDEDTYAKVHHIRVLQDFTPSAKRRFKGIDQDDSSSDEEDEDEDRDQDDGGKSSEPSSDKTDSDDDGPSDSDSDVKKKSKNKNKGEKAKETKSTTSGKNKSKKKDSKKVTGDNRKIGKERSGGEG
ncbi:P-loop containing nucleoside triphosphate hydrolase protein [Apodospora peruviana]|uniref:P-loop containing nucleoside triphosphate hydrolase protein n=1 Tax=Apodospora peruviana TaxID=516989 RepID=A0AAE0ME24_9PEZI|nr:P-loop containing nucleoside triphosphate hydrolase protein [Apodospora peruviana]